MFALCHRLETLSPLNLGMFDVALYPGRCTIGRGKNDGNRSPGGLHNNVIVYHNRLLFTIGNVGLSNFVVIDTV